MEPPGTAFAPWLDRAMSSAMPRVALVALVVVVGLAASCGDDTARPDGDRPGTSAVEGPDGRAVFAGNCAGCHGTDADGSVGPSLIGIAERLTADEQTAVVLEGRGRMPAFAGSLTQEEIDAVIAYTRDLPE